MVGLVVSCGGSLPPALQAELRSPPGTATIVFFTDFQCPYCRRTHAALEPILEREKEHVRLVLKHVPLRGHPNARDAARADVCVETIAGTEASLAFAKTLFRSIDLSRQQCEEMAVRVVGEEARERYRACVRDAKTEERIDADESLFDETKGDGVPLLFIGSTRLDGEQSESSLQTAIDSASKK